jgi:hypothetical protein
MGFFCRVSLDTTVVSTVSCRSSVNILDSVVDPDPHQSDKLDPNPQQFADDKIKCMEYEPILAKF